jgi:hypothetical protein
LRKLLEQFDVPNPQPIQEPLIQSIVDQLHGQGERPSTRVRNEHASHACLERFPTMQSRHLCFFRTVSSTFRGGGILRIDVIAWPHELSSLLGFHIRVGPKLRGLAVEP